VLTTNKLIDYSQTEVVEDSVVVVEEGTICVWQGERKIYVEKGNTIQVFTGNVILKPPGADYEIKKTK
jgi:quercetin dioxygenase-like cupin family protein